MERHMTTSESPVAAFFRSFEERNAGGEIRAITAQFADVFLAGSPQGARCVKAEDFALALPKRKELFASMGCTGSRLEALEETALDARYTLARTRWSFSIVREGMERREVLLESTFLLDMGGAEPRILMYLAHQDPVAALKSAGGAQG